jgi:hypothetical protein
VDGVHRRTRVATGFFKKLEEDMSHAIDTEREERGKGSGVWAVLADNREEGNACVRDGANPNPGSHDPEDGEMNVKQEYSEAGEEKEKGNME